MECKEASVELGEFEPAAEEFKTTIATDVLRIMHDIFFQVHRWPFYRKYYIRDKLRTKPFCNRAELDQFDLYSRYYIGRKLTLMLVSQMVALRYAAHVYYTLSSVNYNDPESTLETVWLQTAGEPNSTALFLERHRFLCLETNCSRLSTVGSVGRALEDVGPWNLMNPYDRQLDERTLDERTRLADDLARLPLFALCQSQWRPLMSPLVYSHIFGIIFSSVYAIVLFIVCLLVPIYSSIFGTGRSAVLTHMLCPRLTLHLHAEEVGDRLEALLCSQLNYEAAERRHWRKLIGARTIDNLIQDRHSMALMQLEERRLPRHIKWTKRRLELLATNRVPGPSSAELLLSREFLRPYLWDLPPRSDFDHLVADCLPYELTYWWRLNGSRAMALNAGLAFLACLLAMTALVATIAGDTIHPRIYLSFAQQTQVDQCAVWRVADATVDQPEEERVQIDLANLVEGWSFFHMMEFVLFLVPTMFALSMALGQYHQATNTALLNIHDLRNQLNVIIELTELRAAGWATQPASPQVEPMRPMRHIRNRLYELIHPNLLTLRSRRLVRWDGRRCSNDLDDRLADQEFAMALLGKHQIDPDAYVRLLEELQINFWIFLDRMKDLDGPVTSCLLSGLALNYSFALLGLYLFQAFKEFVMLPLILVGGPLLMANMFITFASNVHARNKRLELRIWSLIASITEFDDDRVRHLRSLWVKQLTLINANGGLAIQMWHRVNITYTLVIEFVIWTTSILVFAGRKKILWAQ